MMSIFEKTRSFVYRYARPLDLSRWQFHFENGSKDSAFGCVYHYLLADYKSVF